MHLVRPAFQHERTLAPRRARTDDRRLSTRNTPGEHEEVTGMAPSETAERPAASIVADPAPLGLAAFALTTFVLSAHNAGWAPDVVWIGLALFYGGGGPVMGGLWGLRKGGNFG